jgi:pimeloyl-ACP methyl ester carboxylesterase
MGAYTADHNDKVDQLVLYAPVWLGPHRCRKLRLPLGAYLAAPMDRAAARLQVGAPDDRKNDLMPASWFEAGRRPLASDPVGSKQEPPCCAAQRACSGQRTYWDAGKPYYDPERIKIPTLVVVAEWDQVTPSQGAQALPQASSGPNKRLVEIGEGTHSLCWRRINAAFQEVQFFLDWTRRN